MDLSWFPMVFKHPEDGAQNDETADQGAAVKRLIQNEIAEDGSENNPGVLVDAHPAAETPIMGSMRAAAHTVLKVEK